MSSLNFCLAASESTESDGAGERPGLGGASLFSATRSRRSTRPSSRPPRRSPSSTGARARLLTHGRRSSACIQRARALASCAISDSNRLGPPLPETAASRRAARLPDDPELPPQKWTSPASKSTSTPPSFTSRSLWVPSVAYFVFRRAGTPRRRPAAAPPRRHGAAALPSPEQLGTLIRGRRSVFPKDYGRGVPRDVIERALEAASWAPTAVHGRSRGGSPSSTARTRWRAGTSSSSTACARR